MTKSVFFINTNINEKNLIPTSVLWLVTISPWQRLDEPLQIRKIPSIDDQSNLFSKISALPWQILLLLGSDLFSPPLNSTI